jgi:predicted nucleic acid-binding protein
MKPRIYIETTIVSYLTAWPSRDVVRLAEQQITRSWWDNERHRFELFTSQFVLDEAGAGDPEAARLRLEALHDVALLDISKSGPLAELLIASAALPQIARIDAYHLATAAVNGIEYLCTWNCRHLANAMHRRKIEAACRQMDVEPPILGTPVELTEGEP